MERRSGRRLSRWGVGIGGGGDGTPEGQLLLGGVGCFRRSQWQTPERSEGRPYQTEPSLRRSVSRGGPALRGGLPRRDLRAEDSGHENWGGATTGRWGGTPSAGGPRAEEERRACRRNDGPGGAPTGRWGGTPSAGEPRAEEERRGFREGRFLGGNSGGAPPAARSFATSQTARSTTGEICG